MIYNAARFAKTQFLELLFSVLSSGAWRASLNEKESKFWTACYTSHDGRQLKRSTKTTDKNQATEIAIEFERIEQRAKQGALTSAQIEKVFNDVSEKVTGDTLIAPSTELYLDEWIDGVKTRSTPTTVERYKRSVKLFVNYLGERSQKPITSIMPRDVEGFLNSRLKAGMASKTAIIDLKTINIAFRRAENFNIIPKNPVVAVRPPKEICSERDVFTQEEVQS